ncbi:hypothetical protein BBH99_20020 [Chryseobacterium contaminans]|uniref:Uncharacterized protein n=1 Tax=Chryseobacterium contaminans TaxID=1423959 RepID=A0A1M6Z795_9FLAO|nr:hypothetical protein [Chryseobacterium contaminans]OCA79011.1 hypothetical protein BBH99_20020 [Chryseobacterium contaminans]SHL26305.1 hypothetical protein SAMN05444407_103112 [Chryseobacterium contaminans]
MKEFTKSGRGMKYYTVNLLMVLFVFICISCKQDKRNTEKNNMVGIPEIQAVKVVSAGGGLGFSSRTVINKDSIHYSRTMAANEANNMEYSKKLKPENWKNLVDKIDVKMFGAAKEGHSVQPVDGIDTKIIITTSAGDISKMNAYNDSAWKSIRDIIDQYNELYK